MLDRIRSEHVVARKEPLLVVDARVREEAQAHMADPGDSVYDERLRLLLLCSHPVLAPDSAAALTLRLVLGVPTEQIARLFLVPQPTMAARLTRARKRLAGERFEIPDDLKGRVPGLAAVIYLAFTSGYLPGRSPELAPEAIRLARIGRELLPDETSLDALLALMLLQHSRRHARLPEGDLVLLPDQDRNLWHTDEIDEALELLRPLIHAPAEFYLLQALIAAEHAIAPTADQTDWPRIASRYAELEELTGSGVVRLNRAVAVAEADGPLAGLALLDGLDLPGHRMPGVRAELLSRAGRTDDARAAYELAIRLCDNEAEEQHLRERLAAL